MKKISIQCIVILSFIAVAVTSCKPDVEFNSLNKGNFTDTEGTLKAASPFQIGFAVDNPAFSNNAAYRDAVSQNGTIITFENSMKYGSIVRDDGTFNFTNADALAAAAQSAGLAIHGHTLVWHSQANVSYLNSLGGSPAPVVVNLLKNPGFELGTGVDFTNWSKYNGAASFSAGTGGEVRTGSRSLKAVVAAAGQQFNVQMASDLMPTTIGVRYKFSFYIKATAPGGRMRVSTGPTAQYQGDQTIGTDWQLVSYEFAANTSETRVLLDLGAVANTYFIDDASFVDATPAPAVDLGQVKVRVDAAMKAYVQGMINRYKTRGVKSWDVVNEVLADDGKLRTGANTGNTYHWFAVLGKDYIGNAFKYAREADATAELYINDYNLEQGNQVKVDSTIALVTRLRAQGVPIDGIGTQMHINVNSSRAGIINSLRKLGATGLKVKITELDVRINVANATTFTPTEFSLALQAEMYKFVVDQYVKYVPAAQRAGITFWGVDDPRGWLNTATRPEFALLFNADYTKKPAFAGVLQALKSVK
ncbi:endo-1,4-beta-xylanase [Pedobacter alpinus]|uniref:Beta-xylanase n=1 Tax=Pedobacter alpinus TaxID=1590643 RepID=A0ABW5TUA0_9SPHI